MKIYFSLVFFILLLKTGFTQDYHPLVEEGKTWYVVESGFMSGSSTHIFKCEGDTIIADETYKIVYISWDEEEVNWWKYGYIREDEDHKVYYSAFYNSNPSYFEPSLLYDFDAAINDSLTITASLYDNQPTNIDIVITDIDSVLVEGDYRKEFLFDCDALSYNSYIEGIGSNSGLLEVGFYCAIVCPSCDLYCVKQQGITIYPDAYTGSCFIVGVNETNSDKSDFDIFPNPATGFFMVTPNSHFQSKLIFELYNSTGKIEAQFNLDNNHPTQITTNHLESGLYLYLISNENGMVQKGKIVIL